MLIATMSCPVGTDIAKAAAILQQGGLVAFPTETVYGLGANALDTSAVAKVFAAKQRPEFDPLIVHVPDQSQARQLTTNWPDIAEQLAKHFWPGPLTMVLPKIEAIPDLVTSALPSVAIRVPQHPIARELLSAAATPIAAPSANPFGRISPTTAQHVVDQLGDQIDYVLDGGPCSVGIESTVVSLVGPTPTLLRFGGLSLEQLQAAIGECHVQSTTAEPSSPTAPGQLLKHYAPSIPLTVVTSLSEFDQRATSNIGLLQSHPHIGSDKFPVVETLSKTGDLTQCAAGFFAALRRLDAAGLDRIVAVRFPEQGLGRALNDRLNRAAAGSATETGSGSE